MRRFGLRLLILLAAGFGGGSLVLFVYFLFFGVPFAINIAHSPAARLAWDCALCVAFFLQHSGMIRREAKKRLARQVPVIYHPALYSIASGIALFAVIFLWQPGDQLLSGLHGPLRWFLLGLSALAMAGFAWGAHSLREFDPFGTLALRALVRGVSPASGGFVARGPYRYVRHPLYLFTLVLIWATSSPSTDRLLFNVLWTAWVVGATKLEERDLLVHFGPAYRRYQARVPMLIPSLRSLRRHTEPDPD
jgi:protein-S-isoprenylcysteine O-methyltransferase Ste14